MVVVVVVPQNPRMGLSRQIAALFGIDVGWTPAIEILLPTPSLVYTRVHIYTERECINQTSDVGSWSSTTKKNIKFQGHPEDGTYGTTVTTNHQVPCKFHDRMWYSIIDTIYDIRSITSNRNVRVDSPTI